MTDTRMERIIEQLADLTEEEETELIYKIQEARERRKKEKFYRFRDSFFDSAREIEKLGYCLYWGEDRVDPDDLYFE